MMKKEPSLTRQSTPNPSLPEDLLLSCFARVSRLYYPTLSLVSKHFRSLLASPELNKTRSLLGSHTESCLYVCLRFYPCFLWYTLCRKPGDQTLTNETSEKKKSSGYVLARVQIPDSPHAHFLGLVAVGSNIYNIEDDSSRVLILDCTTHKWREAPSLRVKVLSLSASVLDRKIYVAGKNSDSDSLKNTLEVFDTKTQTWDPEPIPCSETNCQFLYSKSAFIDRKFHVVTHRDVVAYNSKECRWDMVGVDLNHHMRSYSYCEIENVLYSASYGELKWYDTEVRMWKKLKGLDGLPDFPLDKDCVRLADYGGKMAVLWEEEVFMPDGFYEKKIWCAEIALERRKSHEIYGKVEWFDHVLTVPRFCNLVKVLAATV